MKARAFIAFLSAFAGIALALGLATLLLWVCGETPGVLWEALYNSLFTGFGLGYTLFYSTPLILTGLSVALAFQCGLFNIGAEGQLYLGSFAVVLLASYFPGLPPALAWVLGIILCALFGGLWALGPAVLKATRGSHEVITTILFNFIAWALVDYLVLYHFRNPHTQNAESFVIPDGFHVPTLSHILNRWGVTALDTTPVNLCLILAILLAVVFYYFLFYTARGYELRAVGKNPVASRYAGISIKKSVMIALVLSGATAGLVGVNEVMGHQHRLIQGFSPGYGFTGIAVALLARSHPIGIIFSALLFGALHNSARELEFLSNRISKDLAIILQAAIVALAASQSWMETWWKQRRRHV